MTNTPFSPLPLSSLLQQGFAHIVADSRQVQSGDIFIAYQGEYADGRNYIQQAIDNGAKAVVYQADNAFRLPETKFGVSQNISVPCIGMDNGRQFAGNIASFLLGEPSHKLDMVGVTGTNGKTSITQWLAQAFDLLGKKCAVIGTAGNGFSGSLKETTHTTPDAVTVHNLLADFLKNQAQAVAMEVSSHGLDQYRVGGVAFDTAIFTNLTRDHLDYHGDMASYGNSKRRLFYFDGLKHAIINTDDPFGLSLYQELRMQRPDLTVISYGFNENADMHIQHFQAALNGNVVEFASPWGDFAVKTQLTGRFNAQNLAATAATLLLRDYAPAKVASVLANIRPAKGRMESIKKDGKPLIIIDYAHTPDALEKALKALHELKTPDSKLWCVFGCGGDRDTGKRPQMGKIAEQNADCVVITSDNPRSENPEHIIQDIVNGISNKNQIHIEPNREQAIFYAIRQASEKDIILIAGKGHETYQEIQGIKHHFDDFEVAEQALAK